MTDSHNSFRDAIRSAGMTPPDIIKPGKFHRFPGVGKKKGNTAGWCCLFHDGRGGCFGDWSSGYSEVWQDNELNPRTKAEKKAFAREVEKTHARAIAERENQLARAAKRAISIWHSAAEASDNHPYLAEKNIRHHAARIHKGMLVLPIIDFSGSLTSLQFIAPNGVKRLLTNGRKRGCFIHVAGPVVSPSQVIICEGWATGCTLAEDSPDSLVLAAIDAGNLEAVAVAARLEWPDTELIIAGDDDRLREDNPGATKANAAAIASGGSLALPPWPDDAPHHLTDFNDLAAWLAKNGGAA